MSKAEQRDAEARRAAQASWAKAQQRDAETLKDKEKARQADAQKTARLRALRLSAVVAETVSSPAPGPKPRKLAAKVTGGKVAAPKAASPRK